MKLSFPARLSLVLLSALACTSALWAQKQGDNPVYYQLNVQFSVSVPPLSSVPPYSYGGGAALNIWNEATQTMVGTGIGGGAAAGHPTTYIGNGQIVYILPNKDYICTVSGNGCTSTASFVVPSAQGFVVYINGVPATNYSFTNYGTTTGYSSSFKLRIGLPSNYATDPEPDYLAAGAANTMVADKPILYFGLGRMRNGLAAGVVGFRAQDFGSTNFFTPSALYYASYNTAPSGEVDRIYGSGANASVLQQILAPEVLVNIAAISGTSYKLDYYSRADPAVTIIQPGGVGTPCTFSGSPFVSYTVAQNTTTGVSVTRTEDAVNWETDLVLNNLTWTFNDWHKQGTALNSNLTTAYSSSTAATITANGPASGLANYTDATLSWTKSFASYPWGLELSQTQRGASTTTPLTAANSYYTTTAAAGTSGGYTGLLQWATKPDGTWAAYSYYVGDATTATSIPSGYVQRIYHPWLDTTASDTTGTVAAAATTANSAYDDYTYQYLVKGAAALFMPSSIISYAPGGTAYRKTTWDYNALVTTLNSRGVWSQTEHDFSDLTTSLTTTSLYYVPASTPNLLDDQPVSTTSPNGRKDSYAYYNGAWNSATNAFTASVSGNDRLVLCFHGQTAGGTAVTSWTKDSISWAIDSVSMVAGYSTVSETVIDTNGRTVFSGQDVYTASGTLARVSGVANTYDTHGRLTFATDIIRSIGSALYCSHRNYTAQLVDSESAPDGIMTIYQYDDLLRQTQRTVGYNYGMSNAGIYPAKVQTTTYDGANRPVATFTCSCGTAPKIFWYDAAGRVTQQSEPAPDGSSLFTNYTYSSVTSTNTTNPSGATTINTSYADGRAKSVTGTAQPPAFYSYSVNSTGPLSTRYNAATTDTTNGWTTSQSDFLGRSVTRSAPTYGWAANANNIIDVASTYDAATGQLTKTTSTYRATAGKLSPDHLYYYDGSGRLMEDGLDLNGDGALTATSNDRYASYGFSYGTDAWGWIRTATTYGYPTGTALQISKTVSRLTGFNGGAVGTNGIVVADTSSTDVNSQTARQVEWVDAATLRHHIDVTLPGVTQTGWSETINGYAAESVAVSGARSKNEYDSLGRLVTVRSRWNGSAYTVADTTTFSSANYTKMPDSQTINSVQTSFAYAWGTSGASATVTTTDAQNNSSYTLYNAMGLPFHTGGNATSPSQYGYDSLGRLTTLTTWRAGNYTEANWPASVATGDTTTWVVEAATGLGTTKTFADGNHVDFTYTPLGQPLVRSWARTLPGSATRVTTTYGYYDGSTTAAADVSNLTQELRSISYNDGTPSVSYTYKRSGLPEYITDAAGQREMVYDSSQPLRVVNEVLSSFYGSRVSTQQYDSVYRPAGFLLGSAAGSASDLSQVIAYDPATGLPSTLTSTPAGQAARTFTYSFASKTQLITGWSTGSGTTAYALTYGYETATNRRNLIKSSIGGATLAEFDPAYDTRGQMQTVAQSGSAFGDYYNSSYSSVLNSYTYDAMGELKQSALYRGSTSASAPASGDELPGHRFTYNYDAMGNRLSSGESGSTPANNGTDDSYSVNSLNQYTQRDNYTVRVTGTAATPPAGKTITTSVAAAPSTSQVDRVWGADIVPGQGANVATGTATVYSVIPGGGSGGQDLYRVDSSKSYTIPPTPQVFSYDADGNLTMDDLWSYSYDAESRLIGMQHLATAIGSGKIAATDARKLVFAYDSVGRRIEKQVYAGWNGSAYSSTAMLDHKFVYNGWNLVAEYNALSTLALARSYTWGLDLAGTFGATGGVGALLQVTDHGAGKNYYPAYDQNGNVVALENDGGTLAAGYEYSPFGEPTRAEVLDPTMVDNPFRFSTKYTDLETGLVYYGLRYYGTKEGRFINRDPIQESGGVNLYGFTSNNPVSRWDFIGLQLFCFDEYIDDGQTTDFSQPGVSRTYGYGHRIHVCIDIGGNNNGNTGTGSTGTPTGGSTGSSGTGTGKGPASTTANAPNSTAGEGETSRPSDKAADILGGVGLVQAVAENGSGAATLGNNLKVYTNGWGGNQYVTTTGIAETAAKAAIPLAVAGTFLDAYRWKTGGITGPEFGANTTFTVIGLTLGPEGAIIAGGYYLGGLAPGGWLGNSQNPGILASYGNTLNGIRKYDPYFNPHAP